MFIMNYKITLRLSPRPTEMMLPVSSFCDNFMQGRHCLIRDRFES